MHASDDIKESTRKQLEQLIQAAGALWLKRLPSETSAATSTSPGMVIVLHEDDQKGRVASCDKSRQACVQHLTYRWLTESAATFHVQDVDKYRM